MKRLCRALSCILPYLYSLWTSPSGWWEVNNYRASTRWVNVGGMVNCFRYRISFMWSTKKVIDIISEQLLITDTAEWEVMLYRNLDVRTVFRLRRCITLRWGSCYCNNVQSYAFELEYKLVGRDSCRHAIIQARCPKISCICVGWTRQVRVPETWKTVAKHVESTQNPF